MPLPGGAAAREASPGSGAPAPKDCLCPACLRARAAAFENRVARDP